MTFKSQEAVAYGLEEVSQTVRTYKRTKWIFFTVKVSEVMKSNTIGNDIRVSTFRSIRAVFINGKEYIEK